LLLAGGYLSLHRIALPLSLADGLRLLVAVTGIPAFVGVAFYGRLSTELTGTLLGMILGFVFGTVFR
jgi:hypothetical protein